MALSLLKSDKLFDIWRIFILNLYVEFDSISMYVLMYVSI